MSGGGALHSELGLSLYFSPLQEKNVRQGCTSAVKWICCMPEWFVFKFDGNQVNGNTHAEHCNDA